MDALENCHMQKKSLDENRWLCRIKIKLWAVTTWRQTDTINRKSWTEVHTNRVELQCQQSKHWWSIWKLHPLPSLTLLPPCTGGCMAWGHCRVEDLEGTAASLRTWGKCPGGKLPRGTNDPAMLPNGTPRPGSLVFYIRLNMVDHSLHSPMGTQNTAEVQESHMFLLLSNNTNIKSINKLYYRLEITKNK